MDTTKTELNIESAVMAIREILMEYFKGTSIERVVNRGKLSLHYVEEEVQYQYQRREHERRTPQQLKLGNLPLMKLEKRSDVITLYTSVFSRSPQLKQVQKGVEKFLSQYLAGVEVKRKEGMLCQ